MPGFLTSFPFVAAICVLAIVVGALVIAKANKIILRSRIARQRNKGKAYAFDMINLRSKRANLYSDLRLMEDNPGEEAPCFVRVSSGGILLIAIVSDKGFFREPKAGEWKYTYENIMHEDVTISYENPFDKMIPYANAIDRFLTANEVENKAVSAVVYFTSDEAGFEYDYPEILTNKTLGAYLADFDSGDELMGDERRFVCRALEDLDSHLREGIVEEVIDEPIKPKIYKLKARKQITK